MIDNPIGEIVESETTCFVAQCLKLPRQILAELYDPPPLGSFVKIGRPHAAAALVAEEQDPFAAPDAVPSSGAALSPAIYALVFGSKTTSLEANRRPSALGFADEDELRREQPQIFELLRTEFSGQLLAYKSENETVLRRHIPPHPPRIHSRVYPCQPEEVRVLTEDLSFLRTVLFPSSGSLLGAPVDELAAACLRGAREAQWDDSAFTRRAGIALAALLVDDYDRLKSIVGAAGLANKKPLPIAAGA